MTKRDLFEWHIDRALREDYEHFGKGDIMEAFDIVEAQFNDKRLVKKLNLQNVSQQRELLITAFGEASRCGYIELHCQINKLADKILSGNL